MKRQSKTLLLLHLYVPWHVMRIPIISNIPCLQIFQNKEVVVRFAYGLNGGTKHKVSAYNVGIAACNLSGSDACSCRFCCCCCYHPILLVFAIIIAIDCLFPPVSNPQRKWWKRILFSLSCLLYPFVGSGVTSYIHDFSNQLTRLNKQYIIVSDCLYYQHAIYQQQVVG